ncbi:MAG: bifunctional 4-hydroxy-3-methylbut-2-enyl diphosphate reductase/30S ribosomal protein S1 [Firmicutes bacterium]|nr:bifunctional 4-hydroxy-3-methylbut-2-enyl diphosphate reductase/30S ribosomal protein S1 [Bacillota bacterium]MDY5855753.1 bifunctional 4-hydroxy-3-methylbut-2-enyl diphosphate reductase/30S ribosomal protein S1 [Anaerovoracaceae bacterium]
MIEIKRAENSGFCFGVKRALMKTEEQIGKTDGKPIYTCGPLIHNRFVTDDLESRGVKIIDRLEQAGAGDIVIVRSHGEPADFFEEAECRGIQIVNATCPFVSKIHTLARKAWEDGYQVVIVGDRNHPEVRGIAGWCGNEAVIVANAEEADAIREDNLFLVCQTTIRKETLDAVVNILQQKGKEITVRNTICSATTDRQNGCIALAAKSDAMVIVGGKESSNTRKLWEISKNYCENSYFVEKIEDLPLQQLRKCNKIGIAAGASTPECVIKEVIATMSENITEMNMQDLMEDIEKSLRLPRVGETVNGKVHQVTEKEIIVNMGCKKDGIIPKEEVTLEGDQKLTDLFHEGDEIQAKVIKTDDGDGGILLSKKKLEVNEHWGEIIEAFENKSIITVKVVKQVNGGVIAAYKEVSGFIPLSKLSDKYVENADEFMGQELDVKVIRVDQKKNRAVFSHKDVLAEEKQKKLEAIWSSLHVDDIVEGTVMRFTDYGAFVDLGGIDGLLHISEISWGKLKHPQEVLQIGDRVKVKILSMNEEKGKISLGLKQTQPEPWSVINEKYEIGQIVEGKVVQLKEYGAFVELEPGLDGLVHISEVANKRVTNIADELEIGQIVAAKILDIDTERRRISLSIKQALDADVEAEEAEDEE